MRPIFARLTIFPLLARGRDRLETASKNNDLKIYNSIPYSLGDAIDWKHLDNF